MPNHAERVTAGLTPYAGAFTEAHLAHLLKRTLFGATKDDLAFFTNKTLPQVLQILLTPAQNLPSPPVKEYTITSSILNPDNAVAAGTTWVNDISTDGGIHSLRRASFKKWWIGLLVQQDRTIQEKMTLFWHNHFATETADVSNANYVYNHHTLLRQNALGNFKKLTRAITLDPAMLVYLNGQANTATAPDENYGRELQELFCCGKGPNSLYTEADVKAAAKVLTGWRNNATTLSAYFTISRHDTSNKQFSSFYNNTLIQGRNTATAGDAELDDLLNMIFSQAEVAKYLCRRIYRWFVYYDIDATTEANVIEPLAQIFRTANYEVLPVLQALLGSEHFFDAANMACQIKSPVDFVVGACREMGVAFQPAADYASNYGLWNYLVSWCSNMQQNIGDPPDVAGWKAYYQAPQFYEIWINSDTFPKRVQFTDTMCLTGYTFNGKKIIFDAAELAKKMSNPGDPNALVNDFVQYFFRIDISQASKQQLKKDILLAGQTSDYYWTTAWGTFINVPTDTANATAVKTKLRDLAKYLMSLAEYQLA